MIKTIERKKKVVFEKGDTIGGTAPLLLMDQIKGGWDSRSISNRRGRKKKKLLSGWLSGFISLLVLMALVAAGLNMFDWSEEVTRFQGLLGGNQ